MRRFDSRLRRLETREVPDWRSTTGLSALLTSARKLPPRDPWAMPDLEGGGSMATLLAEARRFIEAREEEKRDG